MLSDTGISSGTIGVQINNAAKNESPATTETDKSHALTFENKTMKTIDEVAGGSIQRYQQMLIADLKRKDGLPFTAETAIQLQASSSATRSRVMKPCHWVPSSGLGGLRRR